MAAAWCFFSLRPSVAHQCEPLCRPLSLCTAALRPTQTASSTSSSSSFLNTTCFSVLHLFCLMLLIRCSPVCSRSRTNLWADFLNLILRVSTLTRSGLLMVFQSRPEPCSFFWPPFTSPCNQTASVCWCNRLSSAARTAEVVCEMSQTNRIKLISRNWESQRLRDPFNSRPSVLPFKRCCSASIISFFFFFLNTEI